jgi:4-amino-4-deoxy-L-arabinose transferase-like glycosyltransferase
MDPSDGKESLWPDRAGWTLIGGLALLFCWNLGRVELSVTDEARSAVIVRDMVEDGHWLLPRTPDGYLCEKPLAYYGTAALLGKLFGINEWTLRLVSVFMGVATLLMTWILARLYGPPRAARIAVVALASNILFIGSARDALVDVMLAFFLTAGLTAHFASRLGRLSPMSGAALAGLAFGGALLTKGPLGLALPVAVAGGDAILEHRGRFWRAWRWWKEGVVTFVIALAISCVWYVPGYLQGGKEFLETCVLSESFYMPLGKVKGIGVSHEKSHLYYLGYQLLAAVPLLPLWPALVGWARDRSSDPSRRPLIAWLAFGFLLFEIASNKRHYYLLPLQPAVAVMIGLAAARAVARGESRALAASALAVGTLVALAGAAAYGIAFRPSLLSGVREGTVAVAMSQQRGWILLGAVVLFAAGGGLAFGGRYGPDSVAWRSCLVAIVVIAIRFGVGDRLEAEFNRTKPFLAQVARQVPPGTTPVILPPIRGYSLDFYWPVRIVRDRGAALKAAYVLVARPRVPEIVGPAETLGTWKYGRDGSDDVLLLRREQAR